MSATKIAPGGCPSAADARDVERRAANAQGTATVGRQARPVMPEALTQLGQFWKNTWYVNSPAGTWPRFVMTSKDSKKRHAPAQPLPRQHASPPGNSDRSRTTVVAFAAAVRVSGV